MRGCGSRSLWWLPPERSFKWRLLLLLKHAAAGVSILRSWPHTVWGVRLWKKLCTMFSESSPCLLVQHASVSTTHRPVERTLGKTFYKTFFTTWRSRLYSCFICNNKDQLSGSIFTCHNSGPSVVLQWNNPCLSAIFANSARYFWPGKRKGAISALHWSEGQIWICSLGFLSQPWSNERERKRGKGHSFRVQALSVTVTVLGNRKSVTVSDCHSIRWLSVLFGTKNCHCSRIVTLTGVTVTNRACTSLSFSLCLGSFRESEQQRAHSTKRITQKIGSTTGPIGYNDTG